MSKQSYSPQRTCLGCGARDEQSKLIRLTAANANLLKVGRQGSGRGGYLHHIEECWQAFIKRKSVYRAFHLEVSKGAKENLVRELRESKEQVSD
ncbi:MAG: YlxR family protein [Alphaproteobacteria bacterium]